MSRLRDIPLPAWLATGATASGGAFYARLLDGERDWNTGILLIVTVWALAFLLCDLLARGRGWSGEARRHAFWVAAMALSVWTLYLLRWRLDSPVRALVLASLALLLVGVPRAVFRIRLSAPRRAPRPRRLAWPTFALPSLTRWTAIVDGRRMALASWRALPAVLALAAWHLVRNEHYVLSTGLVFLVAIGAGAVIWGDVAARYIGVSSSTRVNIRLLGVTCVVLLIGLELFLRFGLNTRSTYLERNEGVYVPMRMSAGGGQRLYVLPPGIDVTNARREYVHHRRSNSLGLTEREIPFAKAPGEYRIVAIGDSFTEGVGASYEESWVKVLERTLAARMPDRTITAINAGLGGSDVCFEYVLLKERLLALDPQLVILALNRSDLADISMRGGMERFLPDGSVRPLDAPAWEWLYAISFITRHLVHDFLHYNWYLVTQSDADTRETAAAAKIRDALRMIATLTAERGVGFLLVMHPDSEEAMAGAYVPALGGIVADLSSMPGVHFLDLIPFFRDHEGLTRQNVGDFYWPIDGHHTPKGYERMGQAIAARVLDLGLLDSSPDVPDPSRASAVSLAVR